MRRSYKTKLEIQTSDHVIHDFDQIKMEATRHFKAIYSAKSVNTPPNAALMDLVPKLVKRKENNDPMQRIKLDEPKSVMDDMEEDKVLGPDGHSFPPLLFQVMLRFIFDQGFICWVKACISNPWIDPLVNGRTFAFFQASQGLKQGFLLSPLLYAIQASMLSLQLEQARIDHDLINIRIV